ncbi:hypothetical protein ERJ75_001762000 [Trypanosoma vivax]|uniref:Uncharacterized protein n=1 Tax=Trypanosoma vivax (strain Y486) TaxID=1055687 RepID=F9WRE4_TRYVY|nr:hypothetical protein TRVL_10404 [Trypanosoma vivax]KAH8604033.1 hypothetical protein ERJ75_001762000 [Trypanosoma vivax]CCD20128.1 hypothetical protein TvY486_0028950 [Trypanosoma vivax Y486]|eukprot:CCD20128.1 hypothetical protein TvY486_0028950 [Trypanosoma vivax Y486]
MGLLGLILAVGLCAALGKIPTLSSGERRRVYSRKSFSLKGCNSTDPGAQPSGINVVCPTDEATPQTIFECNENGNARTNCLIEGSGTFSFANCRARKIIRTDRALVAHKLPIENLELRLHGEGSSKHQMFLLNSSAPLVGCEFMLDEAEAINNSQGGSAGDKNQSAPRESTRGENPHRSPQSDAVWRPSLEGGFPSLKKHERRDATPENAGQTYERQVHAEGSDESRANIEHKPLTPNPWGAGDGPAPASQHQPWSDQTTDAQNSEERFLPNNSSGACRSLKLKIASLIFAIEIICFSLVAPVCARTKQAVSS